MRTNVKKEVIDAKAKENITLENMCEIIRASNLCVRKENDKGTCNRGTEVDKRKARVLSWLATFLKPTVQSLKV